MSSMRHWLCGLMFCWCFGALASPLLLDGRVARIDPSVAVRYWTETSGDRDLAQVLALPAHEWRPVGGARFGFDPRVHWLRLDLQVQSGARGEWLLEVRNPLLDEADLYVVRGSELLLVQASGASYTRAERPIASSRLLFPLHLDGDSDLTLMVRAVTQGSAHIPLTLWRSEALLAEGDSHGRLQGLLLGMLVMMGIYNLFIFLATRQSVHLCYAGYVLSMGVLLAGLFGLAGLYWPQLRHPAVTAGGLSSLIFALLFAESVLQFRRHLPTASVLLRALLVIDVVLLLLALVLPYHHAVRALAVVAVIIPLSLLAIAIWLAIRHVPLARPYVLAWLLLLLGSACSAALYSGWLHLPVAAHVPLVVGALGEALVLAAILAWRFSIERQSRQRAQQRAVDQARRLRQLRDETLQMQATTQRNMEEKVRERTLELEFAYRELQEVNQRLEELNTIDVLTGVRNRAYFDKRYIAEQRRSRREHSPLSLVMMDIDHFKRINDSYGHVTGDEVIRAVAQRAASCLKRPADVIMRYGGEEFSLLLPATPLDGAAAVAQAIREVVAAEPIPSPAGPLAVTVSLGVASILATADTQPNALLEAADAALYRAKQNGRNRVELAQTDPGAPADLIMHADKSQETAP